MLNSDKHDKRSIHPVCYPFRDLLRRLRLLKQYSSSEHNVRVKDVTHFSKLIDMYMCYCDHSLNYVCKYVAVGIIIIYYHSISIATFKNLAILYVTVSAKTLHVSVQLLA